MITSLHRHWLEYLIEAGGLGVFMIVASVFGTLKTLLVHAGCEHHLLPHHMYLSKTLPVAGAAHQNGTIRFGRDPLSSALDVNCKAHDLDNLYVVDGSFFVSSAAVNPGLTVMANALRVGDHLLDRLK